MYTKSNIPWTFGVELRDRGQRCFLLAEDDIVPTAEENFAGLLSLAQSLLDDVAASQ